MLFMQNVLAIDVAKGKNIVALISSSDNIYTLKIINRKKILNNRLNSNIMILNQRFY